MFKRFIQTYADAMLIGAMLAFVIVATCIGLSNKSYDDGYRDGSSDLCQQIGRTPDREGFCP